MYCSHELKMYKLVVWFYKSNALRSERAPCCCCKSKKKLIYTFRIASEYPQDMEGSAAVSLFLMSGVANIRKTFGRYIYFILSL